MQASSQHVIVIGAGIAGLAAAIRLAVSGMQVDVYEKNSYAGGKLHTIEKDGFRFDAGPSLFTQPQLIAELFSLAGEDINLYLNYKSIPVTCHYFWEDGILLKAYSDKILFGKEIAAYTSDDGDALDKYLTSAAKAYKSIGSVFLDHSLHKRSTFFKAPLKKAMTATRWSYLFKSLHGYNSAQFSDPKLVQLFNRYATFNGSDPYRAPGMLSMIPHLEHNEGVFYPKGGMISIADALYRLAIKKGVRFHFNTPVQRIIVHDHKAIGVVVNDANIFARAVVSNMDAYFTYGKLLGDERKAKKLLKQERSSSALIFYWGIGKTFSQLDLHNIFFAQDYRSEFDHLFRLKEMYDDPTVYINITSKYDPDLMAPAGRENWFVMVNAPANSGQDWTAVRGKARTAILAKLSRILKTEIAPLIDAEMIMDPLSIEQSSASFMGSLYGTSSNSRMAAFLRHPNFSKQIKGLYFAGGTVHPGGGIPLCLRSAKIATGCLLHDIKR